MDKQWYEKKYQVIFIDEYNNMYEVGWFDDLSEAEPELNSYLENYELDEENAAGEIPKFGEDEILGRLTEYAGTLSPVFDRGISTTCGYVQVRGFIR